MSYLRIEKNKFWGWVIVSVLIGLGIGLVIMFVQGAGRTGEINKLRSELAAKSDEASVTLGDLQAQLSSAEASVTDLEARNTQLTSDLTAAQVALEAAKKSSSSQSTGATGTITFVSRSVTPSQVATGANIVLTVKLKGGADKVRMQISGTGYSKLYYLTKVSTSSSGVETWKRTAHAPAVKGVYRYYAGAFIGTKKFTMTGTSAYSFEVK